MSLVPPPPKALTSCPDALFIFDKLGLEGQSSPSKATLALLIATPAPMDTLPRGNYKLTHKLTHKWSFLYR
ncbi:hypothetical protein NHX12_003372 [Muraenolepis orangiensis]|uniref:Uncharacterized protein n=1 Tax=Muraenolepis orangiensis TaxID=630683 RepID=A0A9Q0E2N5_9TELE|nr:hypothetical protein NHX12_003372 [Muraenolepis orangiensis]